MGITMPEVEELDRKAGYADRNECFVGSNGRWKFQRGD
jgi:hypothetical protein